MKFLLFSLVSDSVEKPNIPSIPNTKKLPNAKDNLFIDVINENNTPDISTLYFYNEHTNNC